MKAILANPTTKVALVSISPTSRQNRWTGFGVHDVPENAAFKKQNGKDRNSLMPAEWRVQL